MNLAQTAILAHVACTSSDQPFRFSVDHSLLAANALRTVAYLLPWLLLGYHALREREVAGPT